MKSSSRFAEVFDTTAQRHAARKLEELFTTQLTPGQRLPAERTLAEQFGISRLTLRNVLAELERRSLIQTSLRGQRKVRHAPSLPPLAKGILRDAIVLVTDFPGATQLTPGQPTGWSHYVYTGVSEMIHAHKLHALNVRTTGLTTRDIEQLIDERPRGVVVLDSARQSASGRKLLACAKAAHLPVVVEGLTDPELAGCDTVGPDHETGAYRLTKWLIARGQRRILRYWSGWPQQQQFVWLAHRNCGVTRALTEAGLEILPPVFHPDVAGAVITPRAFMAMVAAVVGALVEPLTLCAAPADAIMAISDGYIPVLAAACRGLRREPNREIALVGYDNYWSETRERQWEPTPPLATVDKLNPQIGRALVQLLLDRIGGRLPAEPQHRLITPRLVATTAPPVLSFATSCAKVNIDAASAACNIA